MASTNNANAAASNSLQFSSLFGCTMESIIHELIYSRSIYPPDSYVLHRHLGVRFHCSRVPQVCDYISNFLKIAIPSIVSGVGDSISLVILEEEVANNVNSRELGGCQQQRIGTSKTIERFVFQFQIDSVIHGEDRKMNVLAINDDGVIPMDIQHGDAIKKDTEMALEAKTQMERSMRDCLLQVLSLRGRRRSRNEKAENVSFKLCLHIAEKITQQHSSDVQCPALMNALKQGEWFETNESGSGSEGLIRPIRNITVPSCGLNMQMYLKQN